MISINKIIRIAVILTVAAIPVSCGLDTEDGPSNIDNQKVEITLKVSGKVTDGNLPIEGIQVKVFDTQGVGYTNPYGTISIETSVTATLGDSEQPVLIIATDIDGDDKGKYKSKIAEYPIGVWYNNQAVLKDIVIVMEREEM